MVSLNSKQPTWLSESLINKDEVELPNVSSTAEDPGAILDSQLEQMNIAVLNETEMERRERLTVQEKWDRWVMIGFTCFVTAGVLSNVLTMIVYNMGIIEIAFMIPLVTGPLLIHQREGLIKCRSESFPITTMILFCSKVI
jgi:hypothetical protein